MSRLDEALAALEVLHREIDRRAGELAARHAGRLSCRKGCAGCCIDGLSVFEVEAERIRRNHARLLEEAQPHPEGRCAFLDAEGACRIYADRPYVCRTQGLPLRWIEEGIEHRDICPLNEDGRTPPLEQIAAADCWPIGPVEERLALLQRHIDGGEGRRIALRQLFRRPADGP